MTSVTTKSVALLNLGCGQRFHRAWTNLDLAPVHESIQRWDVTRALPFRADTFEGVYHSHLLEHLPRAQALPFLRECGRVLKPGGILRIAAPDLEGLARLYLRAVADAAEGAEEALRQHRWLVLEMVDQTTREQSGGAMLGYLRDEACSLAWVRLGQDGAVLRQHLNQKAAAKPVTWRDRVNGWLFGSWRERLIRWSLGTEYELLQIGRFRRTGEVHQWMYDRVSLRELLTAAGFVKIRVVGPTESAIGGWNDYHLDAMLGGAPCKPDSLFVEAVKP